MVDIITLAIPAFFALMGVEALVGRARGKRVFRGPDVATDLALGVMQVLAGVAGAAVLVGAYQLVYARRVHTVDPGVWWAWPAVLLGVDFFYYWFHRAAHRVNIAWASHAPHHSSEDYNLAVALRQGPVQPFFSRIFYLPLALAGFPLEMFVLSSSINTLYQFWIHTELIGRLGPLELVFNTPSHHRVHHGVNGKYIDKNHAGILIVWDRIFGTFQPEEETPTYGTVKQVATWNPLRASIAPFADIARVAAQCPRLVDKVRVWFMPPEWRPQGVPAVRFDGLVGRAKFDAPPPRGVARYVTPMFVVTLLAVVAFLVVGAASMSQTMQWAAVLWLTVSFASLGALLDGWRHARAFELARLLALVPLALAACGEPPAPPTSDEPPPAVTADARITVSRSACDEGSVVVGDARVCVLVVGNAGTDTLFVTASIADQTSAGAWIVTPRADAAPIAPGGDGTVFARFAPTEEGAATATLRIASNDPVTPAVDVALTGEGAVPPTCALRVASVNGVPAGEGASIEVLDEVVVEVLADAVVERFDWRIVSRPAGATADLTSESLQAIGLTVDAAGTWNICASVDTEVALGAECCTELVVTAAP